MLEAEAMNPPFASINSSLHIDSRLIQTYDEMVVIEPFVRTILLVQFSYTQKVKMTFEPYITAQMED